MKSRYIKALIFGAIAGALIGFCAERAAHGNTLLCGLKPVVPLGCQATQCLCVEGDNCFWVVSCDDEDD